MLPITSKRMYVYVYVYVYCYCCIGCIVAQHWSAKEIQLNFALHAFDQAYDVLARVSSCNLSSNYSESAELTTVPPRTIGKPVTGNCNVTWLQLQPANVALSMPVALPLSSATSNAFQFLLTQTN